MAWTYQQARDIAVDQDNEDRVKVAVVDAAIFIGMEANTTDNYANRQDLVRDVLRSPAYWAERFVWGVVNDDTVQTDPSDTNIYNAILSMWNQYAGVV